MFTPTTRRAARRRLGLRGTLPLALLVCVIATGVAAQEHAPASPATAASSAPASGGHAPGTAAPSGDGHEAAEAHGESLGSFLSRLANFGILAWLIWYFGRSPVGQHLRARATQIRNDLEDAHETRVAAEARMAEIAAQMKALPAELDALRHRGVAEVAGEEARIRELAAVERERLLEHTRREIDAQLRAARRDLTRHAADLAVGLAARRLKARLTAPDQLRLVDRYVTQVRGAHE